MSRDIHKGIYKSIFFLGVGKPIFPIIGEI